MKRFWHFSFQFMVKNVTFSCSIYNSITIELQKIFPRTFFLEKIIWTTDFQGIIDKYFPQGVICCFINYNSNKQNYNSAIVNFIDKYLYNANFFKFENVEFINFRSISLCTTIFGTIWTSFIFLLIFTTK